VATESGAEESGAEDVAGQVALAEDDTTAIAEPEASTEGEP
jgi:hypothetical protein